LPARILNNLRVPVFERLRSDRLQIERDMSGQWKEMVVDPFIKEEIKAFPMPDLVRALFPSHNIPARGRMLSPFRDEKHASFSVFKPSGKDYWIWKDFTTGESGDNISFYRRAVPQANAAGKSEQELFMETLDEMAHFLFGRSAYIGAGKDVRAVAGSVRSSVVRTPSFAVADEPVLKVVRELAADDVRIPRYIRKYWRGRGISDDVMALCGCGYVEIRNGNRAGLTVNDPVTGVPLLGLDGSPVVDDGIICAVGMRNDIGGVVFRIPDEKVKGSFKSSSTVSFISTLMVGGMRPLSSVSYHGDCGPVEGMTYDAAARHLNVGRGRWFDGVEPRAAEAAMRYLCRAGSLYASGHDDAKAASIISALNDRVSDRVVVVEGMFDALSVFELARAGMTEVQDCDVVVGNSIGNLKYAVPFIAAHSDALVLLDNDLASKAGQRASAKLAVEVDEFCKGTGLSCTVVDGSFLYSGHNDVNDWLRERKGFAVKGQPGKDLSRENGAAPSRRGGVRM